ncbi:MAG: hypothetical protein BGO51_08115 [Rhodospirillales bacterium 69-11]|nr:hypothetical protein [Rhodospirillales bacterium]MBN8926685.1 hypothetical protein [Rhodospirillales bacterium]OJW20404.1 MAG: hypothetical protein BGO51_08115 [Rhodospirillales bacterium 69-11]
MGFFDDFRRGRDEIRASQAAPRTDGRKRGRDDSYNNGWDDRTQDTNSWQDEPAPQPAGPGTAELEAALRERDQSLEEALRIMQGLKEYAEQMEDRVTQLLAGVQPMARVLLLPGVKTFLLHRFHPDKHPDANEEQKLKLTEAMQMITAVYAFLAKEFHDDD